jgi:transcription elongation factor Elf1
MIHHMKTIAKWNTEDHTYHDIDIPEDWNVKTYSSDLDEIITCPNCGHELTYGDGYCSHLYQTEHGMGYSVCEDCYANEDNAIG